MITDPPQDIDLLWHVLAFIVAAFLPFWALRQISDRLWRILILEAGITEKEAAKEHNTLIPALLGVFERILYLISLLAEAPEFIALWFALRTAGGWSRWSEGFPLPGKPETKVAGRAIFNVFSIGFAASLLSALVTYAGLIWAIGEHYWYASGIVLVWHLVLYACMGVVEKRYCKLRSIGASNQP